MLYAVFMLVGMGLGIIFTTAWKHAKSVGILHITNSNLEDDPYLFLELSAKPDAIVDRDYVIFEVRSKKHTSHK